MTTTRREFHLASVSSVLTFSLLQTLFQRDLFAAAVKPITVQWVKDINDLCRDVKQDKITQLEWQQRVERLFAVVDLPDLLNAIEFDKLTKDIKFQEKGERSLSFAFAKVEGMPTELVFGKQIFALKKGQSVVPHGHNNMATGFIILKGEMRGRHYDRVRDEDKHMIVRPTIDRTFVASQSSTISDFKDNVHWFTGDSDTSFIFNLHVLGLNPSTAGNPGHKGGGRVYIDPQGEKIAEGLIRAPVLTPKQAFEKYG